MENRIVVDSDVLINFLRNRKEEAETLKELNNEYIIGTTDINAFELYYGAFKSIKQDENLASVKGLLNYLFTLSTNEDTMEVAAKIIVDLEKKGRKIEIRDLLIASMCLTNSLPLLTNNKKHFENINGLKLI